MVWSGPPSFVSSSGPSSPNADFFQRTSGTDSGEMSNSITSNDELGNLPLENYYGHRDSIETADLYTYPLQQLLHGTAGAGPGADSGESTPVSVGSGKFTLEDVDPGDVHRSLNSTIIGEDEDEEKTLTGYRDEMTRPRLTEIKWTKSDEPGQDFAHPRFAGRDATMSSPSHGEGSARNTFTFNQDFTPERRIAKSKFTVTEGSFHEPKTEQPLTSSLCGGMFEMDTEEPFEGQDQLNKKSKFEVNRAEEDFMIEDDGSYVDSYEQRRHHAKFDVRRASGDGSHVSPRVKSFNSAESISSEGSSPALTLASSFKDSSSICRGFVIQETTTSSDVPNSPKTLDPAPAKTKSVEEKL